MTSTAICREGCQETWFSVAMVSSLLGGFRPRLHPVFKIDDRLQGRSLLLSYTGPNSNLYSCFTMLYVAYFVHNIGLAQMFVGVFKLKNGFVWVFKVTFG